MPHEGLGKDHFCKISKISSFSFAATHKSFETSRATNQSQLREVSVSFQSRFSRSGCCWQQWLRLQCSLFRVDFTTGPEASDKFQIALNGFVQDATQLIAQLTKG
ncbi:MAG: hypothetical protein M3Q46_03760 [Verrucomicrobiota bacterium]|nr:hypothetical protein [Verrucomicrobiota bacterium]